MYLASASSTYLESSLLLSTKLPPFAKEPSAHQGEMQVRIEGCCQTAYIILLLLSLMLNQEEMM